MSETLDLRTALGMELPEQITREKSTEAALTPQDHLESILFQFVNLYERWAEDRQIAAKQGADIAKFVKAFSEQVSHFESIEEEVRGEIANSIHAAAKNMSDSIGKVVTDTAHQEIVPIVTKLNHTVDQANQVLSRYQSRSKWHEWKIVGITMVSSVVVSLLIFWKLMPYPTKPLTKDQFTTYYTGQILEEAWPKLSEKERNVIMDIYKGKIRKQEVVKNSNNIIQNTIDKIIEERF